MTSTRRNVWELGDDWADPILWYARGVQAMQARALAEPTSWRFYAAIHGFNPSLWARLGFLSTADGPPSQAEARQFWNQCQHGSWYFLPWHRGYVLALEANVRAEVVRLGGPEDWALPYWNYFDSNQAALPPAFASPTWPDGAQNPLFVRPRYGPNGDGRVFVALSVVNMGALGDPDFTGVSSGGSPGFGGVDTGFSHGGPVHGGIETQPHDFVHGLVGGARGNDPAQPGAMSVPSTAALDPIFWLHHANIDRLWESWNRASQTHLNPGDPRWINGPGSVGQREFAMPMPDGATWTYTPGEMISIDTLGYAYDDLTPTGAPPSPSDRRARLGLPAPVEGMRAVREDDKVELMGATTEAVPIRGSEVRSRVQLDTDMRRKVAASLAPAPATRSGDVAGPDRVFLNLENVRGTADAAAFHVYVGVPEDEESADHPERLAGSIAPFGVSEASQEEEEHAGQGLTFVLEITDIVDQLQLEDSFEADKMAVRIVPLHPVANDAGLTIGRISIFRQGR